MLLMLVMRQVGEVFLASTAIVTGDVVMGPGVNIWPGCSVRGDAARLTLGPRVNLQDGCIVHADFGVPNEIEEGVVAGHAAVLHGVRVGRGALVGIGARLLGGSIVGPESIIAAGAVVPPGMFIPERSLVMGIPAKVVRRVTDEEVAATLDNNARYLALARAYAEGQRPAV